MSDAIDKALDQLRALGLIVEDFKIDGNRHRVDVEGQRKGKKPGWYICDWFRLDNGAEVVVGAYGVWQFDENNLHKLKFATDSKVNDQERRRLREQQAAQAKAKEEEDAERAKEAAQRAKEIWAKLPQLGSSGYLARKKVKAFGTKFAREGSIVVPVRNGAGVLVGLQFIQEDGGKKFLTGTQKRGAFHLIGTINDKHPLVFAEGYATGASIHMATGWPVVICFDCGNLYPVARALKSHYPTARILFAGDDDHQAINKRTGEFENAGRLHAVEAAKKLDAEVAFPKFDEPDGRTDFNDLHIERGIEVVREQLHDAWSPLRTMAERQDIKQNPWKAELAYGDRGLKPMAHNVMLIMENDPRWQGVFAYNSFAKRIVMRKRPPYGGAMGWVRDVDEIETAAWFGSPDTYDAHIPTHVAREAMVAVAERHPWHPLREYLDGVKWDGEPRIETFFADFCNVTQTPIAAGFARVFFIQAVARIYIPGCKADLMLVLEGEQGAKKSTLLETLFGKEFYADIGTPPSDKDFYQAIQGVWGVEISEMASFVKAETAHIKRAISVAIDRFRKSYGHNVEDFKRECVFGGTANNGDWQRDETGGRRFLPQWVSDIDIDAVKANRDQLWAEAVHRFKAGEDWYKLPDGTREVQDERYLEDVWGGRIFNWLEGKAPNECYRGGNAKVIDQTSVSEILLYAVGMDVKKQDRNSQTRAGNFMRRLGWRHEQRRLGGTRVRVYLRPPGKPEEGS